MDDILKNAAEPLVDVVQALKDGGVPPGVIGVLMPPLLAAALFLLGWGVKQAWGLAAHLLTPGKKGRAADIILADKQAIIDEQQKRIDELEHSLLREHRLNESLEAARPAGAGNRAAGVDALEEARMRVAYLTTCNSNQHQQLSDYHAELTRLRQRVAELEKMHGERARETDRHRDDAARKSRAIEERDAEIVKFTKELTALRDLHKDFVAKSQSERDSFHEAREVYERTIRDLHVKLGDGECVVGYGSKGVTVTAPINDPCVVDRLKEKLATERQVVAALRREASMLTAELDEARKEIRDYDETEQNNKHLLAKAEKERDEFRQQVERLHGKVWEAGNEKRLREDELEKQLAKVKEYCRQETDRALKAEKVIAELRKERDEIAEQGQRLAEARDVIRNLENRNKERASQINGLTRERDDLRKKVDLYESALAAAWGDKDAPQGLQSVVARPAPEKEDRPHGRCRVQDEATGTFYWLSPDHLVLPDSTVGRVYRNNPAFRAVTDGDRRRFWVRNLTLTGAEKCVVQDWLDA